MTVSLSRMTVVASLVACALGIPAGAQAAQPAPDTVAGEHHFTVGAGQWGMRSPLEGTSESAETGFFPWLSYKNSWVSIDPSGLSVQLYRQGAIRIEGLLSPRWQLSDPEDSSLHNDLRRRTGVDAGARVNAALGAAVLALSYRADVSGRIDGHEITAEAGYGLPLPGAGQLGIRGGAYWRDSHLNTYLYGVFADEARADRPEYRVDHGVTPFAGLVVTYPVAGRLSANLAFEAQYLSAEIADSPIIARRVVPSAVFGLFYSF
jgi:outer membrane protein